MVVSNFSRGRLVSCRRVLAAATSSIALSVACGVIQPALAQPATQEIAIESQSLEDALLALSTQTDTVIYARSDLVAGKTAPALSGDMTVEQAFDTLLAGTGLEYRLGSDGSYVIAKAETPDSSARNTEARKAKNDVIIVTATKRAVPLTDVPASISVVDSEMINSQNLVSFEDYLRTIPGVSLLSDGPGANVPIVRGVSSNTFTGSDKASLAGVYFGETVISGAGFRGGSADLQLVDIERVEVLRGPQGTLFGGGVMSGLIRYVPASVNLEEVEGKIKAGASTTGGFGGTNTSVVGVLNVPIIEDMLGVRAVAYRTDDSGVYRSVSESDPLIQEVLANTGTFPADTDDRGALETTGARLNILFNPLDNLSVNAIYAYQKEAQKGWDAEGGSFLASGDGIEPFTQTSLKIRDYYRGSIDNPVYTNDGYDAELQLASLTANYNFGWANLTSATSWMKQESERAYGGFGSGFGGVNNIAFSQIRPLEGKYFTQEVRLVSDFDGPFQFVAGYFYQDGKRDENFISGWAGYDVNDTPYISPITSMPAPITQDAVTTREWTQNAFFGELSYSIIDELTVTVGGRHFTHSTRYYGSQVHWAAGFVPFEEPEFEASGETYKASVEYEPVDDMLFYATWSQGFRVGQEKPALSDLAAATCDADMDGIVDGTTLDTDGYSIDSDTIDNYELGGKLTLLDGRMQVNAAAFQMDWKDIPVLVNVSVGCSLETNAGSARVRGVEMDTTVDVTDALTFNFSTSYIDAELTSDIPAVASTDAGGPGDRLPGSPTFNASVGLRYDFVFQDLPAYVQSDYGYVGSYYPVVGERGVEIGGYGTLNVNMGIEHGPVSVGLYAKNLTDESDITNANLTINPGFYPLISRLRPRTIGLNLSYSF